MRIRYRRTCCAFGMILLSLLLAGAVPHAALPSRAQPAPPTWYDTGITLAGPTVEFCFDATQAYRVFVNEAAGTVAYDWRTGARTVVNPRPYALCTPTGLLFAAPTGTDPPWRFSSADPVGRAIAHLPTHLAADGTSQVYSIAGGEDEFWYSADGGVTWQSRHFGIQGEVTLDKADARILYKLYSNPSETGCNPRQTLGYLRDRSTDTGQYWQWQLGVNLVPQYGKSGSLHLQTIPGAAVPAGSLLQIYTFRGCTAKPDSAIFMLTTDGGYSFSDVGQVTAPAALHFLHTSAGLLRWTIPLSGTTSQLEVRYPGQWDWWPVTPAFPHPGTQPAARAELQGAAAAPALVFLAAGDQQWYSTDGGRHWQPWAGEPGFGRASPYLPMTLLKVQDGHLYRRAVPEAARALMEPVVPICHRDSTYVPETAHNLADPVRAYWEAHGGLAQFGYPITEALRQITSGGDRVSTTQYFERAVLAYDRENSAPDEVIVSDLGAAAYQQRYGAAGAPNQQINPENPRFFPETGRTVGGRFRTYWEQHGGLAQQGYPLSDEVVDQNPLNGQPYTVQYFERAVFEWHPEYAGTPYEVLLRHLGTWQARQFGETAPNTAP
jgi:hypothetical protein